MGIALSLLGFRVFEERAQSRSDIMQILYHQRVMTLSLKILSDAKDLETGQRGYLLTGDSAYLDPYQKSRTAVIAHLEMLLSVSRKSPEILAQTEGSGQILAREISILNRTITTQETAGRPAALAIVRGGRGKRWMDRLRLSIGETIRSQNREIVLVESRAFRDRKRITREFLVVGSGSLIFFFLTITILFREIRSNSQLLEKLEAESTHDELTGIPNRRFLLQWMKIAMAPGRNEAKPFCLLFLDLDHFKTVNDRLGHKAGDLVLKKSVRRFQAALREEDLLVRIGGDEFVAIIMTDLSPDDTETLRSRLKNVLATPSILPPDFPARFGVSVGYARYPGDSRTPEELLQLADAHMYADKTGRQE